MPSPDIILLFDAAILYVLAFVFLINHLSRGFPFYRNTPYNFTFIFAFGVTLLALGVKFIYLLPIR